MPARAAIPFIVGQWVRGASFYGRQSEIAEILEGPRDRLWLLGTHRIGKTSLLKQLELVTIESPDKGYLPLFWDLQGSETVDELSFTFSESILDAERRLLAAGIDPGELAAADLFESLDRLRRQVRSRSVRLLLLCDEAEELIRLGLEHPFVLSQLRRALQSHDEIRSVLASTIRLWALAEQTGDTSSFLRAFTPPLYLRTLRQNEARALIAQTQLAIDSRRHIADEISSRIRDYCGDHPYLLQMMCKRYLEVGDVDAVYDELAGDGSVASLFLSDLETLSATDVSIVETLSEGSPADQAGLEKELALDASVVGPSLSLLESLGFVRKDKGRRFTLRSPLLGRWLQERSRSSIPTVGDRRASRTLSRTTEIVAHLSHSSTPEEASPDELFELVYDPLRDLAGRYLRRERVGHTLQPTALVHEAYLKLVDQSRVNWRGRTHFFAVGAKIMRRILIDHARSRGRFKRGGDQLRVTLTGLAAPQMGGELDAAQLLALDTALQKLASMEPRQARVVELRCFAGLKMADVAVALGVSKRTADGDWARARDWLRRELRP